MAGGRVEYRTGGGIVADSDPDAEWDEALAKAEAFARALAHLRLVSGRRVRSPLTSRSSLRRGRGCPG